MINQLRNYLIFKLQNGKNMSLWTEDLLKSWNITEVTTDDGLTWGITGITEINHVDDEVQYGDLTSKDIVLDVGAHVGGFTLRAAKIAKLVIAVEPVFHKELWENVKRNHLESKVVVVHGAIGLTGMDRITFNGRTSDTPVYMLQQLRWIADSPVTFLKLDVEGAEWDIYPDQLKGIKRIEFEAHSGRASSRPYNQKLVDYLKREWKVIETTRLHVRDSKYLHCYPKERA